MILPLLMMIADPECDHDVPQQDYNQCLAKAFASADAELNQVWKPAYAEMQRRDTRDADTRKAHYAQTLLGSQRAWIAYRDAQCLAESQYMWGGSGEAMMLYGCKLRLTQERVTYLRGILEN